MTNFNEMTVPELRALCKERGNITGYSRMRKAELIEVLTPTKSEIISNVAKESGLEIVDVPMTQIDPEDMRGVPTINTVTEEIFSDMEFPKVIDFGPTMPENLNRRQRRMWMKRKKIKASNPHKNFRVAFS